MNLGIALAVLGGSFIGCIAAMVLMEFLFPSETPRFWDERESDE